MTWRSSIGTLAGWAVAALLALPASVHAQARGQEPGEGGRDRGGERGRGRGPERQVPEGRGRGRGQMPPFARMQMAPAAAPAMAVSGGKLYIVLGRELRSLEAETLQEEAKADVPEPPDDERTTKIKEAMLKRLDKDGDGFITKEESPRPDLVERLDKDGDGKVSRSEMRLPGMMMRPPGPAALLVEEGSVYVFQDGWLYRFDAEGLELRAKAKLASERPGLPGDRGRGQGQDWGRDRGRGGDWGRDRGRDRPGRRPGGGEGGRANPPRPEVPEDPVAF